MKKVRSFISVLIAVLFLSVSWVRPHNKKAADTLSKVDSTLVKVDSILNVDSTLFQKIK